MWTLRTDATHMMPVAVRHTCDSSFRVCRFLGGTTSRAFCTRPRSSDATITQLSTSIRSPATMVNGRRVRTPLSHSRCPSRRARHLTPDPAPSTLEWQTIHPPSRNWRPRCRFAAASRRSIATPSRYFARSTTATGVRRLPTKTPIVPPASFTSQRTVWQPPLRCSLFCQASSKSSSGCRYLRTSALAAPRFLWSKAGGTHSPPAPCCTSLGVAKISALVRYSARDVWVRSASSGSARGDLLSHRWQPAPHQLLDVALRAPGELPQGSDRLGCPQATQHGDSLALQLAVIKSLGYLLEN